MSETKSYKEFDDSHETDVVALNAMALPNLIAMMIAPIQHHLSVILAVVWMRLSSILGRLVHRHC